MLQSGDEIIPGFKLEAFLGKGAFGQVWRAASPGGTHLALKFIDLNAQQGQKEFRSVQRIKGLRHPNLVPTYAMWLLDEEMKVIEDAEFGKVDSEASNPLWGTLILEAGLVRNRPKSDAPKPMVLVIATALCDQNLLQRMNDCQAASGHGIPVDELLGYMSDAAKAIDFLNAPRHQADSGLVAVHHCDIKPANIMLVGDSAVVGDFGVVHVLATTADAVHATTICGSAAYSAPEMFHNRTEPTTDQYSLAITYYELRTGKLPVKADSMAQMIQDKSLGRLSFELVSSLEAKALQRATSVQPDHRYASATEFVNALIEATSGFHESKKQPTRVNAFAAVTAMVLLVTIGAIALTQRTGGTPDIDMQSSGRLPGKATTTQRTGNTPDIDISERKSVAIDGSATTDDVVIQATTPAVEPHPPTPAESSVVQGKTTELQSLPTEIYGQAFQRVIASSEYSWMSTPNQSGVLVASRDTDIQGDFGRSNSFNFSVDLITADGNIGQLPILSHIATATWPPLFACDASASRVLVAERDLTSAKTFTLFDLSQLQSYDLAGTAANRLAGIQQAIFLVEGHSLLLLGRQTGDVNESLYWIDCDERPLSVRQLDSEYGEPSLIRSDLKSGFLCLRDNVITHCIRARDKWVERAITMNYDPGDSEQPMTELSQSTIRDFVVGPHRWLLMALNDSSLIAARLFDTESSEALDSQVGNGFRLAWTAPEGSVTRLDIADDRLVVSGEQSSATYSLEELNP